MGWHFLRHGTRHDIYTDGLNEEEIPRHKEINERLAQDLIKKWGL
jgi:mRNA interferase HicA